MGLILAYKKSTAVPQFSGTPQIIGSLLVGQTLTGSYNITNATSSVTLSWMSYQTIERLDPIERATTAQYTIDAADADRYLEFIVTATNNAGTTVRSSEMSQQVLDETVPLPQFTVGATVAGQPKVGFTLTANYTAVEATSVTFQWQSSADNVTFGNISGATSQTYTLSAGEQGDYVRVVVTATNASGSVPSTSAATGQIAAADAELPPPAGAPVGAIPLNAANVASRTLSDGAVLLNQSGKYYYLVGDMTFTGAAFVINSNNITLDFNGCTVTYNTSGGQSAWGTTTPSSTVWVDPAKNATDLKTNYNGVWAPSGPNDTAYSGQGVTAAYNQNYGGLVLKNGTLKSDAGGHNTHAVVCYNPYQLGSVTWTISSMRIESGTGRHSVPVKGKYLPARIYDSVLIAKYHGYYATSDRYAIPAAVWCDDTSVVAERSVIIGGVSGLHVGSYSQIRNCFISNYCFLTNGWAVVQFGKTNVLVEDCVCLPYNGRGIYFDLENARNSTARNNVVLAWEYQNYEYTDNLTASPFKTRLDSYGHAFYGNHCLSVGGRRAGDATYPSWSGTYPKTVAAPAKRTSATGMWSSAYSKPGRALSQCHNNIFRAIYYGVRETPKNYSAALGFQGPGPDEISGPAGCRDEVYDNACYSNHAMICTNEVDGYAYNAAKNTDNSFYWQTGSDAYSDFTAAIDAKLATLGMTTDVLSVASDQKTLVVASLSSAINQPDAGLQSFKGFWLLDYYTKHDNQPWYVVPNNERLTITDPVLGDGVSVTSITYPTTYATGVNDLSLRVARTHTLQILDGVTPVANATVTVTPLQVSTEQDDVTTTTTNADGFATVTYYEYALVRTGPTPANATIQTGTSSTIAVDGVGSATLTHASLPATIDIGA